MGDELTLARRKRPEVGEAIRRLQEERLGDFVLVTRTRRDEEGLETLSVLRSDIRQDMMLGMLSQVLYYVNAGILDPDGILETSEEEEER